MRILFISDVYFPRVNGVSTSIRTFRADLVSAGIETVLVAPAYAAVPGAPADSGVIRVPSSAVPGDPEDRRMRWRALCAALARLESEHFDLVHIPVSYTHLQRAGGPHTAWDEPGVLRVAAAKVPRDPEDRRMKSGAMRERLAQLKGCLLYTSRCV